ncbi:MAG: LLM class flavin-dependent oxidoreductase [Acidimicrobiales bacterium]
MSADRRCFTCALGCCWGGSSQGTGEELTAFGRRAEALGYDSMWLPEIVGREAMASAGWLLASTSTLRVGTAIASVYARTGSTAAMASHTLAELSGGRFVLSLGVSVRWLVEQLGQTWEKPLSKAADYLDDYEAMDVQVPPPPRPAPVYFAAHGPRIIDTVKDRVDGIMTINVPPAHTADVRAQLRDDQDLIVLKNIVAETDPDKARAQARERVAVYLLARQYWTLWPKYGFDDSDNVDGGTDRLIDMLVAWGDADKIQGQVNEYFDAGATDVVLMPASAADADEEGIIDQLAPARS